MPDPPKPRKLRTYKCNKCHQAFTRAEHLNRHTQSLHTLEPLFACSICGNTYQRRDVLKRHLKTLHSIERNTTFKNKSSDDFEQASVREHVAARQHRSDSRDFSTFAEISDSATLQMPLPPDEVMMRLPSILPSDTAASAISTVVSPSAIPSRSDVAPAIPLDENNAWFPNEMFDWGLHNLSDSDIFSLPIDMSLGEDSFTGRTDSLIGGFHNINSQMSELRPEQSIEGIHQNLLNSPPYNDDRISVVAHGDLEHSNKPPTRTAMVGVFGARPTTGNDITDDRDFDINGEIYPQNDNCRRLSMLTSDTSTRWINGYIKGLHVHLPFLHLPSTKFEELEKSLYLAISAIGALYCLERAKAWQFIEEADKRIQMCIQALYKTKSRPSLQLMQAMLLQVYFGAWSGNLWAFEAACGTATRLALMIRREADCLEPSSETSWRDFIKQESFRRLYFCTFNTLMMMSEVYGTPTPVNLTDVNLPLPSSEAEWMAVSEEEWQTIVDTGPNVARPDYRSALSIILERSRSPAIVTAPSTPNAIPETEAVSCSSLGGLVLIHTILQHTYHLSVVQRAETRMITFTPEDVPSPSKVNNPAQTVFREQLHSSRRISELKIALMRWEKTWNNDPEAKMSPTNMCGPLSFNATAHYRVAHLRLYSDFAGVRRALRSQDANCVFTALSSISASPIYRTNDITHTTYPAVMALEIPVRMGIKLFTYTASLTWSLEHFVAAFECGLFLCYWLLSIERDAERMLTDEEKEVIKIIEKIVEETREDPAVGRSGQALLSVSVLKIWASTFSEICVWEVMKIMGQALSLFADHLIKKARNQR